MIKIQRMAVFIVEKVLAGTSLTVALQNLFHEDLTLSHQERGAIQDLSYGVLRFYGQLTGILALLLKKSIQNKKLNNLLLVSLYQLQYSKSPAYAVVDHAVSTAATLVGGKKMRGLVNAVLRNFMRQRETLLEKVAQCDVGHYAYPQWWIDKLREQYPQDFQAILKTGNKRPAMILRVNRRKGSVKNYQELLLTHKMEAQLVWRDALKLTRPVSVEKLPGFSDGLVSVQDAGAQMAGFFLDVQDGMRVLDACAAPGGKSMHLMELAQIALTVLDNDSMRLDRVKENFKRIRCEVDRVICGDAAYPEQWWDGLLFDRILADVPCSASGVVRRHPDIKWLRRERDIPKLVACQQEILNALWSILKKGGKLLYVTCSVFIEENRLQIDQFRSTHIDARQLPLNHEAIVDGQMLPGTNHDGFYYALLQKV